ncbi:MAG: diaminopimelate decarboxylase [Candidatus Methanomethylicia archaeon]
MYNDPFVFQRYIENLKDRGLNFKALVEGYGTPLYLIDLDMVKHNYITLKNSLDKIWERNLICYAYKANTCLALLKFLNELGAGAEVVSSGELYAAKLVNVPSNKIVFDGVSKSPNEIFDAVSSRILLINIENIDELYWINKFSSELNVKTSIGVRVNFDIPVKTHAHIGTGARIHKFGLSIYNAFKAYETALKLDNIHVSGIHIHLGSQIFDIEPYRIAVNEILNFCSRLYEMFGIKLEIIDLGGGFGIPYSKDERIFPLNEYCEVIRKLIDPPHEFFIDNPLIIFEPGRFIVGNSGILLTRVNYVKEDYGFKWVLVDAGMNDLIRPALYGATHTILNLSSNEELYEYNVAGPICESSDVFGFNVKLNKVNPGDILAIMNTGAYGFSMSSNYNSRPRAAIVVFHEGKTYLARRRETYVDLFSHEIF